MSQPPNYSCSHVTQVLQAFSDMLESCSDVQNSLAMEGLSPYDTLLSQQLFRHVKKGCDALEEFLNDHDPEQHVRPPSLVLLPPASEL